MVQIDWSDRFSLGVEELDRQHAQILDMINLLAEADGASADPKSLATILSEMTGYITEHLRYEEQHMRSHVYPAALPHAQLHREFEDAVARFSMLPVRGAASLPDDVLDFLYNWWVGHILVEDMKYRTFLEEQGFVAPRAAEGG